MTDAAFVYFECLELPISPSHTSPLSPRSLPVKRQTPIRSRRAKVLAPPHLGQPLGGPERLIRLTVRSDARLPVDGPDLGLAVHGAAEEVLARVVPVDRRDPRGVAREVADVLAVLHVVKGDDGRVAGGGEPRRAGGEGDSSNGLCQA